MILFQNDWITLTEEDTNVFITVSKEGLSMRELNDILVKLPRIKLTKFSAAKFAVEDPTAEPILIGRYRDIIEVIVSADDMIAYVVINMSEEEYEIRQHEIPSLIVHYLKENDVSEGIIKEKLINTPLVDKIAVAEGIEPTQGDDAIIEYYKFSDKKPKITNDGKVDHYELALIDNVKKGDWLGKRIPPTLGEDGITVKGTAISAKAGRDYKLKYDPNSVEVKTKANGVEELFAKINGAVKMNNGRITVDNHLIVDGDVEFTTGHIEFDGYVTVTGTVKDKFKVVATRDISINGEMGVGSIELIESKEGSVLIKGGINGKGVAVVRAALDVYTKYANEAKIMAGRNIHVGLYAIDSHMEAKKIMLSPDKGRIIGGKTYAAHRIETGSIGNKSEKPTRIYVEGFERSTTLEKLNYYKEESQTLLNKSKKLKRELEVFERNFKTLDEKGIATYEYLMGKHDEILTEMNNLLEEISKLEDVLKTKGEGEVNISNSVFPKTLLEIKTLQKNIRDKMTGSFYVKDKTFFNS